MKFFAVVKYSRIVEVINFASIFSECKLEIPEAQQYLYQYNVLTAFSLTVGQKPNCTLLF